MALQFSSSLNQNEDNNNNENAVEIIEPKEETFNLVEKRKSIENELINSPEIETLTAEININDPQTIVSFGGNAAEDMAKCSDGVLNNMTMAQVTDSGKLLDTLADIMKDFDIDEVREDNSKGLLNKLFNNAKKQLEKILAKYHTMGDQVEKINVQLKEYEEEIKSSNKHLEDMFETNVTSYQQLVKYIVAGERGLKEIDDYLEKLNAQYEQTGNNALQLDINNLQNARLMLEQRVQDLKVAENVAMQSVPMIKTMQYSNLNLIRKINSAFIITLPVFKQALTQAILLKRQKIQAKALEALDERTNEMLLKNAQNTVATAQMTAKLASSSSVKIETLEQTWRTICTGIEETKRIQEEASRKREEDSKRLEVLKADYKQKMNLK